MERNEIYVIYGKQYKAMTKEILKQAGLAALIGDRNRLVGIKPNLLGQVKAEEGGTTHPCVVEGLIEYLQENGFHNAVILEGSWVGDSTEETVKYCGYDRICETYGIPFWDMQKEKGCKMDCKGLELNVCRRALQVDFLINVPVLKGHCQTRITCALKNMKGLIPNYEKRRFHRMGLHKPIGHLSAGIRQDFILADSICGDLTFEDGGNPVEQNRLIATRDPVLCDTYGCRLLDISPETVPYIGIAAKLGVGNCDLDQAKITTFFEKISENGPVYVCSAARDDEAGGWEEAARAAYRCGHGQLMKLAELAEAVDSCSACYGYLLPALQMLEREGLLKKLEEKICIGQGYRGKTGELGVGNCTGKFVHTVEGCPPTEHQIYEFLKGYLTGSAADETEKEKS